MSDFRRILEVLCQKEVRFILVGGVAARIHGSARLTKDLDLVYARDPGNVERLSAACADLEPFLCEAQASLQHHRKWVERSLRYGRELGLRTTFGDIELLGEVPSGGSFDDLIHHSEMREILGLTCRCVDLPTLLRLKKAAGRPKDREAIAELEAIRKEELPS